MGARYQVVGELATFKIMTPDGLQQLMLDKGRMLPAGVLKDSIDHLLSVRLIKQVGDDTPVVEDIPDDVGAMHPDELGDAQALAEVDDKRVEARAALPADGSKPPTTASKATWVEYAVDKGYAYTEAMAGSKADLIALFKA